MRKIGMVYNYVWNFVQMSRGQNKINLSLLTAINIISYSVTFKILSKQKLRTARTVKIIKLILTIQVVDPFKCQAKGFVQITLFLPGRGCSNSVAFIFYAKYQRCKWC